MQMKDCFKKFGTVCPSWYAMQSLIAMLELGASDYDMLCNTVKTVCMMFSPKDMQNCVSCISKLCSQWC